jgi:branched-chain amino acid transport system substrate-binding protein
VSHIERRVVLLGAAFGATSLLSFRCARAADQVIRIGVLTDMTGPYAEASGPGDVLAVHMAVEDFAKLRPDIKVEVLSADMLLKPDVGANIARSWFDRDGVDMVVDMPQSAVAIAVGNIAKEKDKLAVFTSAGVPDLTAKYCTPNQIHWTYDLWANGNGTVRALMSEKDDTWFFIVADYLSGHSMANDAAAIMKQMGGREVGRVAYPFPGTTDFSSQLVQAKASGAPGEVGGGIEGVVGLFQTGPHHPGRGSVQADGSGLPAGEGVRSSASWAVVDTGCLR